MGNLERIQTPVFKMIDRYHVCYTIVSSFMLLLQKCTILYIVPVNIW